MAKLFLSKKHVRDIEEFMENYIGKTYDGEEKLTHRTMNLYLEEKGLPRVERVKFDKVKKATVLSGEHIVVKDKNGQIIPYRNPRQRGVESLLQELSTTENVKRLQKVRKSILSELGYKETCSGNVVKKEDLEEDFEGITENVNRQKMIVRRSARGILRSNYR